MRRTMINGNVGEAMGEGDDGKDERRSDDGPRDAASARRWRKAMAVLDPARGDGARRRHELPRRGRTMTTMARDEKMTATASERIGAVPLVSRRP